MVAHVSTLYICNPNIWRLKREDVESEVGIGTGTVVLQMKQNK